MTVMAILQEVDKCIRCNGCVVACKREWNLKNPTNIADVKPQRALVNPRQRLAIKSLRRADMGPFVRFTCWHCPDPPCAYACPLKAIKKMPNGAVAVDNTKCDPNVCKTDPGPKPCETGCQRGGYPKVGLAYEGLAELKSNKCTLCSGRAGADSEVDPNKALQTTATAAEIAAVPEKAHMPACVSSCPAKAMRWDTRANIEAYLNDPANGFFIQVPGASRPSRNWVGGGSMYWASKKVSMIPPKADPFIEDHMAPMTQSLLSSGKILFPTLFLGGLAALSARRAQNESLVGEEV
jgi:Fe-S-cluster-containing dehydrogenase component